MAQKTGLRERRKLFGWSQEALAEKAGVSQGLVSAYERGQTIRPEFAAKIEAALSHPLDSRRNSSEKEILGEPAGQLNESSANADSIVVTPNTALQSPKLALVPGNPANAAGVSQEVERALGLAFDGKRHLLTDALAVLRIAARLPLQGRGEKELSAVFRGYLDAAAQLRERSLEITMEALFAELTLAQTK